VTSFIKEKEKEGCVNREREHLSCLAQSQRRRGRRAGEERNEQEGRIRRGKGFVQWGKVQ